MSIDSIKYIANKNISDTDIVKMYLISGVVFLTIALIPSMIF